MSDPGMLLADPKSGGWPAGDNTKRKRIPFECPLGTNRMRVTNTLRSHFEGGLFVAAAAGGSHLPLIQFHALTTTTTTPGNSIYS